MNGTVIVYSDDHGQSWCEVVFVQLPFYETEPISRVLWFLCRSVGAKVTEPGVPNEAQLAVLANGSLILNMRNADNSVCACRIQAYSDDDGLTFSPAQVMHSF